MRILSILGVAKKHCQFEIPTLKEKSLWQSGWERVQKTATTAV